MRWVVVIGCVLASCSESTTSGGRDRICVPGDDAVLFSSLSSRRWGACGANIGLCLELSAEGTYRSVRGEGDYSVTTAGRWNFLARDAASGVVCTDDGSVIDFALSAAGLRWGLFGELPPRDELGASGDRTALPDVLPADELYALTAHPWAKTNAFDLHGYPTAFALRRDGTFTAEFRDAACTTAGTFSLIATERGMELAPRTEPNTCDTRGGGTQATLGSSNELPHVEDDVLRLYGATYRDPARGDAEHSLAFSAYGDDAGLLVGARWSGAVVAGVAMPWHMSVRNPSPRTQTVTSLRLALTPLVESAGGFQVSGSPTLLLDRALRELVEPDGVFETTATLTFAGTGLVMLEIDVSSYDERQRYDNLRHFIFEL